MKDRKKNGIIDRILLLPTWFWITATVVIVTVGLIRRFAFGVICMLRELTGIPCPACGMSRALLSLVRLDIAAAFRYHPVFWVFPIACVCAVMCAVSEKRRRLWITCFVVCAVIFLLCWVIRLATGTAV